MNIVKLLLSALVLVVLAWAGCALVDDSPLPPATCVVIWAVAVIVWVFVNFGNPLNRSHRS